MHVVELTAFHVAIPLRRPIRHASHVRTTTDNVVVRCVLADGSEGFGEGVPRDYVTGETVDSALALLRRSDLASQLGACSDYPAAVAMIDRLRLASVPGDDRGCQGNAARCALELALLDAYGKRFGQPVCSATRLLAPDLYQPRPEVRYSGVITSARGMKARLLAWGMRFYGFNQVKVKVGIAGHDDIKRLRVIRRGVGKGVELRVDANEAWSPDEAVGRIQALEPFGLASVEQPVPHADLHLLADVRRQVGTPIMLDESLCSPADAEAAVTLRACDVFNLRLSKCGGFLPSLRLARFAREHGVACQLGCQVGETALLSAAGRHFAASVANLRAVEGSYDRHLVGEPLGTEDLTFGPGGRAPALARCGLGVTVDPEALARVTRRKETLLG